MPDQAQALHSSDRAERPRARPEVSVQLSDGSLAELVLDSVEHRTRFAVFRDGAVSYEPALTVSDRRLVPYSPENNLLRHGVVLFPSAAEEYGTAAALLAEIRAHLRRYVDLSPSFETIAAHYVLLTWLYDDFAELPYLRVRGDAGSGKTRFLMTVGSLSYKPIFASGASTVSPLFRILDAFRGTLVLDESDFRMSDEKAEVVKILNNGNAKGFPVLRSEVMKSGEVNPTAFHVFGPKLIATRSFFEDRALETRCITEDLGSGQLRKDIPISLPRAMHDEALRLRNKLLMFRFRNRGKRQPLPDFDDAAIEPRLRQVFAPLFAVMEDGESRAELRAVIRSMQRSLVADRGLDVEADVLAAIRELMDERSRLGVAEIARRYAERFAGEGAQLVTPKWVGTVLRRRLRLDTQKSHGVYVIPPTEHAKLVRLFEKYGIGPGDGDDTPGVEQGGAGDVGTSGTFHRDPPRRTAA